MIKDINYNLFVMDWLQLQNDMKDVAQFRKPLDTVAYSVFFTINELNGLPCWFATNNSLPVKQDEKDNVIQFLKDDLYVQPIVLAVNKIKPALLAEISYEQVIASGGSRPREAVEVLKDNLVISWLKRWILFSRKTLNRC